MVILFDIDDTLVDHTAAERAGATALYHRLGASAPLEEFLARWSDALERHFERFLAGEVSYQGQRRARIREFVRGDLTDREADELVATYIAAYEGSWSLFSDVRGCLDRLSAYRIGVVSNGEAAQQRSKLERTGILARFERVLISGDCGLAKPSPEIFLLACSSLGVPALGAIYVGDRYEMDALAARRAGLHGVWLDRAGWATDAHESPILRTLEQLPDLVARVAAEARRVPRPTPARAVGRPRDTR